MQELRKIKEDETLANSLDPMNKNWESIQSQHSGISFPKTNVMLGQPCFREDELALYICADVENNLWVKIADLHLTYVNKEYVDAMHIDLGRVDNLIGENGMIKMSLLQSGLLEGQLVVVGRENKIATSLIDTGVSPNQIVQVGEEGKIPMTLLNVGVQGQQIPLLDVKGKMVGSTIPDNVARFDANGKLTFPNGAKLWVG